MSRLPGRQGHASAQDKSRIMILNIIEKQFKRIGLKTYEGLDTYRQNFTHEGIKMFNLIGVLEGRSKKDEYVIISAHYDHVGTKKDGDGDYCRGSALKKNLAIRRSNELWKDLVLESVYEIIHSAGARIC